MTSKPASQSHKGHSTTNLEGLNTPLQPATERAMSIRTPTSVKPKQKSCAATHITPAREAHFLEVLAATGIVTLACEATKISKPGIYMHRKANPLFAQAWSDALETATDALEFEARRRAVKGVPTDVFWDGEIVGSRQIYSDNLLMFLLKGANPEKYRERVDTRITADVEFSVKLPPGTPPISGMIEDDNA